MTISIAMFMYLNMAIGGLLGFYVSALLVSNKIDKSTELEELVEELEAKLAREKAKTAKAKKSTVKVS
jgi:ABC-type Fe3+-hydroxamate transport system substrate-binding protein